MTEVKLYFLYLIVITKNNNIHMIEDYYGFSSYGNTGGLRSQRSAQRT